MFGKWLSNKATNEPIYVSSPLTGTAVSLERVPDEAFAGKHMGDGLAIEPAEGNVYAPFDGTIIHLIDSKHALIIEHSSGLQLLIHVGINTIELKGEGYATHVAEGEQVNAGQKLISFDIDFIRTSGYPVITPVVVANVEVAADVECTFREVRAGEPTFMKVALHY